MRRRLVSDVAAVRTDDDARLDETATATVRGVPRACQRRSTKPVRNKVKDFHARDVSQSRRVMCAHERVAPSRASSSSPKSAAVNATVLIHLSSHSVSHFCPQFRELVGEIVDKLYEYPGLVGETPADFVDMGKLLQRSAFTWRLLSGLGKKKTPSRSAYNRRSQMYHSGVTSASEVRPTCFCKDDPQIRSHLRVSQRCRFSPRWIQACGTTVIG